MCKLEISQDKKREPKEMAPRVGFEPTTLRLTAGCSAVELPRNVRTFMKCLTARLTIIHK